MTAPLRDLLGQLAEHEARTSAAAAPDLATEARQMRVEIGRRRARRAAAAVGAVATVLAIGVVAANVLTASPVVVPAEPGPSESVTTRPEPSASTTAPTAIPTTPTPTSAPPPAIVEPPARPQQADITHGNDVWGTYVALVDAFDTPAADAASARIAELGYEPSGGEVGCDRGAAEALGVPESALVVATYFTTKEDAELFAEMYGPGTLGVAEVTLWCLD